MVTPVSAITMPGQWVAISDLAANLQMNTAPLAKQLAERGYQVVSVSRRPMVRRGDFEEFMASQPAHIPAASAQPESKPQPVDTMPSVDPETAARLTRQETELEALRRQVEQLLKGVSA